MENNEASVTNHSVPMTWGPLYLTGRDRKQDESVSAEVCTKAPSRCEQATGMKVGTGSDGLLHDRVGPLDTFPLAQRQSLERDLGGTDTMTDTQDICEVCSMCSEFTASRLSLKKAWSHCLD